MFSLLDSYLLWCSQLAILDWWGLGFWEFQDSQRFSHQKRTKGPSQVIGRAVAIRSLRVRVCIGCSIYLILRTRSVTLRLPGMSSASSASCSSSSTPGSPTDPRQNFPGLLLDEDQALQNDHNKKNMTSSMRMTSNFQMATACPNRIQCPRPASHCRLCAQRRSSERQSSPS